MNAILEQINSAGLWFVEFALPMLVQSSLLILILLLADFALRKKVRAVFRYWIWLLVLLKLVLPTSLSAPLSLGYFFGNQLAYVDIAQTTTETAQIAPAIVTPMIDPPRIEAGSDTSAIAPTTPTIESVVAKPVNTQVVSATLLSWQGAVFLAWLTVVLTMGLLLLQRAIFVRGLVAQAKKANSLMNDTFVHCCERMGVKRKIGLKVSANASSPAVCGLFRPVILVPQNLTSSLSPSQLRAVLLHELAHIKRGDLWVNLAQTILQIIYFYNPLLWVANCIIRRVREQAVDEMVLVTMGEKARQYPQTLVNVAKLAFKRPALSLRLIGVVESQSALAGRIKHILNRPMPKRAKLGILGLAVVIITAAILLPMATCTPGPPSLVIKGTVKDAQTQEPIAGARVFDDGYGPKPNWEQIRADERFEWGAITNSAGEYSFLTWPEHHSIKVEAPGYKPERQSLYDGHFVFNTKDEETFNFALEPEKASDSSEFKTKLPNGVTVELIGICEHPSDGKQWWRPDGTILRQRPYDHTPSIAHPDDTQQALEMAAQISGLNDIDASAIWNIPCATSSSSSSTVLKRGDVPKGLQRITFVCPKGIKESDMSIGIAADPWNTISSRPAKTKGSHSEGKLIWHQPYEKDGKTIIAVAYSYQGNVRITALSKEGEGVSSSSSIHNVEGFSGMEAKFHLPLDKIREFQFQTRSYQWVEFKNVSLRPGVKTDVQVEVGNTDTIDWIVEDYSQTRLLSRKEIIETDNWVSIQASVVKNSGRYLMPDSGLTLKGLIKAAGYNRDKLAESYVELIRPSRQGNITAHSIYSRNLKTLLSGEESDIVIKPHDAVVGGYIEASANAGDFWGQYSFSDVVELAVNDDGAKINMFADLDTGKLITPPDTLDNNDENAVFRWIKDNGIDVMGETADSVRGLVGFNMFAAHVDNYFWDADPVDFTDRLLIRVDDPVILSVENLQPVTYLIKTSEHKMGILQILGFAEKPKGIKIRYKLLNKEAAPKTDVQVEIEPEKPAGQVQSEGSAGKQLSSGGGYQNLSREQRERLERLRANRKSLSYKNMQKLGLAVAVFANDHKGRCPSDLSDLRKYIADEKIFDWINRNVVYLGKNQEYGAPPDAVLAYDESMLKKPRQETNVLYNDAHVSFEKSEWLELKATSHQPGRKPDVQVEVEQGTESSESINTEDYDKIPSDSVVVRVVDTKGRIIPIKDVPYTRIYYRDATTGNPIGWQIDLQIEKTLSDGLLLVNHRDVLVRKFLGMNRETKRNDYTISMCFQPKEGPVFSATTLYPQKATEILSFVVPPRTKVVGVGNVAPDELAGRVVDVDGNPVAGATISVYPDRGLENHPFKTDSQGTFRVSGFGDRWCLYIKVEKDGYATQWLTDFEIGKNFIVTMDQNTVLRGVFVNDSGEQAGRMKITLAKNKLTMQPRRGNRVGPITITHETDDKGSYDFPVEPGLYDVKVASESGLFNRSRVFIGAGQIVSLPSTLKPGIRFQVKVVDSLTNKPIKGVSLWIDSHTAGRVAMKESSRRTTDSKGLAVWESLMPGNTSFSIRKKGYCRWWSDACLRGLGTLEPVNNRAAYSWQHNVNSLRFDLIPDMPVVVIKMEKGVKLSGLVLSPDGKSVEKAEVDVTPAEVPHTLTGDSRYRMITDENGRFGIEEKYWRGYVPAGKQVLYNLCAHDPEARWANAVSKPFASKPADEFEFILKMTKGGWVSGRVIDSEGKPVPDIEVEAIAKDNLDTPYFNPRALTDENGTFTLGPMREGKYWIQPDTMKGVNIARSPKQEKTEVKVVDGKVTSVGNLLFRTGGPNM